jgi:hypothetical protein
MTTAQGVVLDQDDIEGRLREVGYARLLGADTLAVLDSPRAADWRVFADSWNHLGPDLYMADGRYRRRRHAAFRVVGGIAERKPHQPHYQSRDYNPLNGDVQRWFEPVDATIAASVVTQSIFRRCGALFTRLSGFPGDHPWHVELHQFRIEATREAVGQPTPEGRHRDGVDWVFVMLIDRQNVAEGVTEIGSPGGQELGRFVLAAPGDAILLDDHRILHSVTPITAIDPGQAAYRDALVVTFATEGAAN